MYIQKNGNRIYKVGSRFVQLPKQFLNKVQSWTTFPFCRHTKYDRKIVESILILTIGSTNINAETIDENVKNFIRGKDFILL